VFKNSLFETLTAASGTAAVTGAQIRIALCHYAVDHCDRATHAVFNGQRAEGAVLGAGPAFHAVVNRHNSGTMIVDNKDAMGTDFRATSAAGAFFSIHFQGRHAG
jgi:hypothetical protein